MMDIIIILLDNICIGKNILAGELLLNPVKNIVGDKRLYRWRKANLMELLEDYEVVAV